MDPKILGIAMTAYFGGRAETRLRKVIVPVVHTDFLSMYPTVNALMGTWPILIADRLDVVDVTEEVQRLLTDLTPEWCFDPAIWARLCFFALVEPAGDVLPVRAHYHEVPGSFGIGVNPVTADGGLWFAGPDVVAARLLSKTPLRVLRAFRLVPHGVQKGLRRVKLRRAIPINPREEDFFRRAIEARQQLKGATDRPEDEQRWLRQSLKNLANAGGYGVFAEMNPETLPRDAPRDVMVYGLDAPFRTPTAAPEALGEYCFPPLAALTTAAARLMLALLERCVTDQGGTYLCCDTDSMMIVASEAGGLLSCPMGDQRLADGRPGVRALSYSEVEAIRQRFASLNPYDPAIVPGSILKIEDENYQLDAADDLTDQRQQLYGFAISAKRYALFNLDTDGRVVIRKPSEHGLGHLLDPEEGPERERDHGSWPPWIEHIWSWIIDQACDRRTPAPAWFSRPAISRVTISSPPIWRSFTRRDSTQAYRDQIKPMNFVLSAQVAQFGHPDGADPHRFHPLAPFSTDASAWLSLPWINKYDGQRLRLAIGRPGRPDVTRVVSYGDVVQAYLVHPEAKSADADGRPCGRGTVGLLRRRPVHIGSVIYTGKESNRVDDVEHGLVHDTEEVRATYNDPRRDPWVINVLPVLRHMPAKATARRARCSVRSLKACRNGHTRPRPALQARLVRLAAQHALRTVAGREGSTPDAMRDVERLLRSLPKREMQERPKGRVARKRKHRR